MMKVDTLALYLGLTCVGAAGSALFFLSRCLLRLFSLLLLFFLALEIFLLKMPSVIPPAFLAQDVWWALHAPSVHLLGVRGGVESAGRLLSTVWHLGDLVAWAVALTVAFAVGGQIVGRRGDDGAEPDADGASCSARREQQRPDGVPRPPVVR